MKLSDYLAQNDIKPAAFAKDLNVTSEAVRLWLCGGRKPREDMLALIAEKTNGAVTPNDFFDFREAS